MTTPARCRFFERRIIGRFIKDALAAGYRIAVSSDRGYDHEDMLLGSTDKKAIFEHAFAADECHIFVQPKDGPTLVSRDATARERLYGSESPRLSVASIGWVYCILGESGWDVIADYSLSLEKLLEGANKLSDKFSE